MREPELSVQLHYALGTAADKVLNAYGASRGCQPLCWTVAVRSGELDGGARRVDYSCLAVRAEVIRRWAEVFDLQPDENPTEGTTSYRGQIDHIPVFVWAVTDDDAFDQITGGTAPRGNAEDHS